jgi:hypothetical protein
MWKSAGIVKTEDSHKPIARALSTLDGQADAQAEQIVEQAEILYQRLLALQEKKRNSLLIYRSEMGFQPIVMGVYHLYTLEDRQIVSMVGPTEWGRRMRDRINWIATIRLDYDHTWDIVEMNQPEFFANQS